MAKPFLTEQQYKKTPAYKRGVPYSKYVPWWQTQNKATAPGMGGPLSVEQMLGLAQQAARDSVQPQQQELERMRKEDAGEFARQGRLIDAKAAGLAELFKNAGDPTRAGFSDAASDIAGFAKGYSDDFRADTNTRADSLNALLAKNNSPQRIAGDQGGADVLYGLGGFTPAAGLRAAGESFGAAADKLPQTLRVKALDDTTANMLTGAERNKEYRQQQSNLLAQIPGLTRQSLGDLASQQNAIRATNIQEQYLLNTARGTGAQITGFDPLTGAPTFENPLNPASPNNPKNDPKRGTKKAAAVVKRNDATVDAFSESQTYLDGIMEPGTKQQVSGRVPVEGPPLKQGKTTLPQWYTKGGKLTDDPNDKNILYKPVYEQVPLPRVEYRKVYNRVLGDLRRKLKRFGVKETQLRQYANDLLDDYYTVVEKFPSTPGLPPQSNDRRGGR